VLGAVCMPTGQYAEAERLLLRTASDFTRQFGARHEGATGAYALPAQPYELTERPEEASVARARVTGESPK
jgi:hypothetical protein